ncbi:hypothetical protein [Microbulbifer sp. TYP-18]|uniref:hypothetical protein n=1 Tax=Microbulbifer sp. TYP-18 TaxID=3230024 RepID=UPI0034C607B2
MKNIISLIGGMLVSIGAFAAQSGFVDISDNRIQIINDNSGGRLFVYDVTIIDSTCDNNTTPVLMFSGNELAKEMYSMVLAAKSAGKQVNIVTGTCVDLGGTTYSPIISVYMQ